MKIFNAIISLNDLDLSLKLGLDHGMKVFKNYPGVFGLSFIKYTQVIFV